MKKDAVKLTISKRALESALESARSTFPNEFIGLFRGKEKNAAGVADVAGGAKTVGLTELIIAPLSEYGEGFSSYSDVFLPMHLGALASFHSHPSPPALPSKGDLHFFSRKGKYHFIACPPFDFRVRNCVRAFDSRGNELEFNVE